MQTMHWEESILDLTLWLNNMLARLNDAWPGFNLSVDNVVSDDTERLRFLYLHRRRRLERERRSPVLSWKTG